MLIRRILAILIVVVLVTFSFLLGKSKSKTHVEKYPPGMDPERVILSWNKDQTSTTQSVSWRTCIDVKLGKVQWIKAVEAPQDITETQEVIAETRTFTSDVNMANYHHATITNLTPDTQYMYRVGDGNTHWSEWYQFKTAKNSSYNFSFLYFGDFQNGIKDYCSRIVRNAYSKFPKSSMFLFGGDLTDNPEDSQWGEWFDTGDWIYASVPVIAAAGNHEYIRNDIIGGLGKHWKYQFNFPKNGPAGLESTVFYYDYEGVRFIILDTTTMKSFLSGNSGKIHEWLEKVLANNSNKWTIVVQHHPFISNRKGEDHPELEKVLKPLYDKYNVDLVLMGHDHTYGRSGFRSETENKGPVYVISTSGSKMYYPEPKYEMRRMADYTQMYQNIEVKKDSIIYSAYTANDILYDQFIIQKRDNMAKSLIENIPVGQKERMDIPLAIREKKTKKEINEYQEKLKERNHDLQAINSNSESQKIPKN